MSTAGDHPSGTDRIEPARRSIVDGMNLIGSRPDGWWRDRRAAMRRLVDELDRHAEASGDAITVVFEGEPFEVSPAGQGDLRVLFAARRGRDAADDRIVELVAGDEDPSRLQVVTSDRELGQRVRALGASVVPSGTFARRTGGR